MIIGNGLVQGALRVIGDIYGNIVGTVNGHNVLTDVPTILDEMVGNFSFDNDYAEYKSWQMEESINEDTEISTEWSYGASCREIIMGYEYDETETSGASTNITRSINITPAGITLLSNNTTVTPIDTGGSATSTISYSTSIEPGSWMQSGLGITAIVESGLIKVKMDDNSTYSSMAPGTIYEDGVSLQSKYLGIGPDISGYHCISVNGSTDVWVRIPQRGLIPYTPDATNGDGSLGTVTYPFATTHTKALTVANIEMQPRENNENNGGWIDFHYNKSTADYTVRIIEPTSGILRVVNTTRGNFQFYDYSGTNRVPASSYITNGKQLASIGTNASGVQFMGQWGTAGTTFSERTIAASSSDVRLKENIADATINALDVINRIKMRQFDWKDGSGHWDCGMVVDEMEQDIDPKFSIGGEDDTEENPSYKSVNTFYLQGYEVKAIQELSEENENLKKTIQSLEERITLLEKAVTR